MKVGIVILWEFFHNNDQDGFIAQPLFLTFLNI